MRVLILAVLFLVAVMLPAQAENAQTTEKLPPNVDALLSLLADPGVQKWLEAHKSAPVNAEVVPVAKASPLSHPLADYVSAIRNHIYRHARALPTLPDELASAGTVLTTDIAEVGVPGFIGLLMALAGFSFGAHCLYGRTTSKFVERIAELPVTDRRNLLVTHCARFAHELGYVVAIAGASIGVFVALDYWPDIIERIILAYILAIIAWLIVRALLRFLLSPPGNGLDRYRIVPMDAESASFWNRRLGFLVLIFAIGAATDRSLVLLNVSPELVQVIAYVFGLGLLIAAINTVRHVLQLNSTDARAVVRLRSLSGAISAYFVLVWCLWAFGATQLLWLVVILAGLLWAIAIAERGVFNIMKNAKETGNSSPKSSASETLISRGIRLTLIICALLLLARAWNIDLVSLSSTDTVTVRIVHGVITAVIILLVADLLWGVLRTLIDNHIANSVPALADLSEESKRSGRLSTLLPVIRNFLAALIAGFATLMALSAMGVEVGPLLAGAGIAGVAIGFGAQTLVKDIISGVFYLLDDAFRVGEYIESGSYKGTVESFSLRSMKLRHNRGPIFTVPFGSLGAIQNMSRDWVVDKPSLTITYDSDVEKARKLIKKIGLQLAEDPEFKPFTLEPLKLQGVEEFNDYGIVLKLKLKTRPGEQLAIRRRGLMMIKKAFDDNGIKLATSSIEVKSVAGSQHEPAVTAAAQSVAKRRRKPV